jgi:hypothetical protein
VGMRKEVEAWGVGERVLKMLHSPRPAHLHA